MKKILLKVLILIVILPTIIYADSFSFEFVETNNQLSLKVKIANEEMKYEEAVKEHGLEKYLKLYYKKEYVYFYMGKEITEQEYLLGEIENRVETTKNAIRVKNTEEFINAVKKIYNEKKVGKYTLIYTEKEYDKFDLDEITKFYKENILTDININTYKFADYGIYFPVRFMPIINNNETIINFNTLLMTDEEYEKVKEFTKYFTKLFKGKSEYEKISGVYNYIKDNTKYTEDDGYEFYVDGLLSPYDIIFKNKMVCIGAATTFQYFMEELGVESYIVDKVQAIDINSNLYATSHTYNIVKLDNKWYIIDLAIDGDAFLTANSSKYSLDTNTLNLNFANKDYEKDSNKELKLDYKDIEKKIKELKGEETSFATRNLVIIFFGIIVLIIVIIIVLKAKNKKKMR